MKQTLIVCGYPRSSTTITQVILDSHPQISITQEMSFLQAWYKYMDMLHIRKGGEHFSLHEYDACIMKKLANAGLRQAFYNFHALRNPEAIYIGDKLPSYILELDWFREEFSGCKFLLCNRNREETVASMLAKYTKFKCSKKEFIGLYKSYEMHFNANKEKDDCFIVDQERYFDDPEKLYEEISTFLQIENKFDLSLIEKTKSDVAKKVRSPH